MRFLALDFETASHRPDSACQVGIVIVEKGKFSHQISQLIRPPNMYFSPRCVEVHGIRPADVKDAPTWEQFWDEHSSAFEDYPIVAHNATFDLTVMCAASTAYGITCPYLEYSCSRLIARRAWPGQTSYALKPTANRLGFAFKHHDALEDAKACATIVLSAAKDSEADTFEALENNLAIDRGRVQFGVRIGPKSRTRKLKRDGNANDKTIDKHESAPPHLANAPQFNRTPNPSDLAAAVAQSIVRRCGEVKPLAGKRVVLSGRLLGLDRATAVAFLETLGGVVQTGINMHTQFVIIGTNQSNDNEKTFVLTDRQTQDIQTRTGEGQAIRILSQRQLLALIPGGSALARASIQG